MNNLSEHDIQNAIRLKLSELGFYTERINVGSGFLSGIIALVVVLKWTRW